MMKRGVIFTFMAMLALGLLFVLLTPAPTEYLGNNALAIRARIAETDNYVRSLDEFTISRALYVNSYRAVNAMAIYVGNETFFQNEPLFNKAFKEVLLNGTLNQIDINSQTKNGLYGKGLFGNLREVANATQEYLLINTTFSEDYDRTKVQIFQDNNTGSWKVSVNLSINYTVEIEEAIWNRTSHLSITFSIIGLDDPLYIGNTGGNFTNKIEESNFTSWTYENFRVFWNSSQYTFDSRSPSYLQRFWNSTSPSQQSCCGIESFVRPDVDRHFAPGSKEMSYIDCDYFGGSCGGGAVHNVSGITNDTYRFKLDGDRAFLKYNAGGQTY